jgi:hypothetical protein
MSVKEEDSIDSFLLLGRVVGASVSISVGVALSSLLALGSGSLGGAVIGTTLLSLTGSGRGELAFSKIILLVLVLGASSLGISLSKVSGLETTNIAVNEAVIIALLLASLLAALNVELSEGGVTLSSVVVVGLGETVITTGFIGKSGEFFFFLLLLESSLLLLSFFKGFFLCTLELGLTDGLFDVLTSKVHLRDVHDQVRENEQNQGTHQGDSSTDLNVKFGSGVREDENSNNESRVEGLIGEHVGVVARSLVGLAGHNVEDVCVRAHKDEHVLQEDEGVLDGEGQEQGGQQTSSEEVGWVDHTPFTTFVNLEQQSVEALLGLFQLEHSEASENDGDEEHGHYNGNHEQNVREEHGHLAEGGGVISLNNLHDGEESDIEVDQHVVADVQVELELRKLGLNPSSASVLSVSAAESSKEED